MKIAVTVELGDRQVALFGVWASLGRTFDNIEHCLESVEVDDDQRSIAIEEIKLLHRPLENLHSAIRTEIWKVTGPLINSILADNKAGTINEAEAYSKLAEFGWSRFKCREHGVK